MDVSEKSVNSFKISPMFKVTDILPQVMRIKELCEHIEK